MIKKLDKSVYDELEELVVGNVMSKSRYSLQLKQTIDHARADMSQSVNEELTIRMIECVGYEESLDERYYVFYNETSCYSDLHICFLQNFCKYKQKLPARLHLFDVGYNGKHTCYLVENGNEAVYAFLYDFFGYEFVTRGVRNYYLYNDYTFEVVPKSDISILEESHYFFEIQESNGRYEAGDCYATSLDDAIIEYLSERYENYIVTEENGSYYVTSIFDECDLLFRVAYYFENKITSWDD